MRPPSRSLPLPCRSRCTHGTSVRQPGITRSAGRLTPPTHSLAPRYCRGSTAAIVSVDTTGLVNLGTFTKFIRWSVDTQCLLDGSAGRVVAVSVLLPPVNPQPPTSAVAAGLAAVEATGTIIALSTTKSSFIVALHPEPRVMFKWDRPTGALVCVPGRLMFRRGGCARRQLQLCRPPWV